MFLCSSSAEEMDIRLDHPFTCLGVDKVLHVITALLTERSILFVSSHYHLPTYITKVPWTYSVHV